jgi:N-methylhydantoinase A
LALNTLLQRTGARCGLLVTEGFRDVLELQRLRLPDPHGFYADKPRPLIARRHVREVSERLLADGRVYRDLDRDGLLRAAAELVEEGVEALVVGFLHAYREPRHEREAATLLRERFPEVAVTISSDVWPQQREYERILLTVVNAYVGGALGRYFGALATELRDEGVPCAPLTTTSNGGVMSVAAAADLPVQTLLSGPASGVRGAMFVGASAGHDKLVTFDLGGTSADIAVVDGRLPYATENVIGEFPMIMPVVDLASIGAGGGSLAWTDPQGVLKVGPTSAGADPGPAAYGRGGTQATLTDAYLAVGILDPSAFLGGEMPLRRDLAVAALADVAEPLGRTPVEAAEAIVRVATSNMYAELLPLMARKGIDPQEFALIAYGGAGPTHAFLLAREVGIPTVLVPPHPGTLCALGCLIADVQGDVIRTVHAAVRDLDDARIAGTYREMADEARAWLDRQGVQRTSLSYRLGADARYHGQSFETPVELDGGLTPDDLGGAAPLALLVDRFHAGYEAIYGYADGAAEVEIINLRLTIIGRTPKPTLPTLLPADGPPSSSGLRSVHLDGTARATVYRREDLLAGHVFEGPAIVEQYDTTSYVPAGYRVHVDATGTLVARYDLRRETR